MAEKRKIWRVLADGTKVQVFPQTSAEQTVVNSESIDQDNVLDALVAIKALAQSAGVTGVKGDKESTYRKGNVNITPVNIGALADTTKYGATIDASYNATTGVVTITLKDQTGATLTTKTIDLPLELLVNSGTVETCETADTPVEGYVVGDKYIDLVLANNSHIYILASALVDQVTLASSGSGNAVTALSVSGNKITYTKGATFVPTSRKVAGKTLSADITLGAADIGALPDTTKYAGSATAGGAANSAAKLSTARSISVSGAATGAVTFDGSADVTIPITLVASGVVAGTYSVITVNSKGIITSGGQLVEWGTSGATEPSDSLVAGGIFFELQ